jgi:hypothetical protein
VKNVDAIGADEFGGLPVDLQPRGAKPQEKRPVEYVPGRTEKLIPSADRTANLLAHHDERSGIKSLAGGLRCSLETFER